MIGNSLGKHLVETNWKANVTEKHHWWHHLLVPSVTDHVQLPTQSSFWMWSIFFWHRHHHIIIWIYHISYDIKCLCRFLMMRLEPSESSNNCPSQCLKNSAAAQARPSDLVLFKESWRAVGCGETPEKKSVGPRHLSTNIQKVVELYCWSSISWNVYKILQDSISPLAPCFKSVATRNTIGHLQRKAPRLRTKAMELFLYGILTRGSIYLEDVYYACCKW